MPSANVKAAYKRVVPKAHRRALETQVDTDKVERHNLEDKVLVFFRNNTSGAAPTDIGNIAPGCMNTVKISCFGEKTASKKFRR